MIEAYGEGSSLYLSGKVHADPNNDFQEYVYVFMDPPGVEFDQNNLQIDGDFDVFTSLDARGLRGVGVFVLANSNDMHSAQLTNGFDVYSGGSGRDVVFGRGGIDVLFGGGGNDRLFGNSGGDALNGEFGKDTLIGNGGDDTISGGAGGDKIRAGSGDDSLIGGDDHDHLWGDGGDDLINGNAGRDIAFFDGNRADFDISIVDGNYRVTDLRAGSPEGTDHLAYVEFLRFDDQDVATEPLSSDLSVTVSEETLFVSGQAAQDDPDYRVQIDLSPLRIEDNNLVPLLVPLPDFEGYIHTVDARNVENSGVGILNAYAGYLTEHDDAFYGRLGYGYGGHDTLRGNSFADQLFGGADDDLIIGDSYAVGFLSRQDDADTLVGGQGNDTLDGYVGDDVLKGGKGADQLWGGPGDDQINGGGGHDVAVFWGDESDYVITEENGVTTVAPVEPSAIVGTDTLINVEELLFVPFLTQASAGGPIVASDAQNAIFDMEAFELPIAGAVASPHTLGPTGPLLDGSTSDALAAPELMVP